VPALNCSWAPASTECRPGAQLTRPCTGSPSSTPDAPKLTGSAVSSTTSTLICTVVSAGKSGAVGRSNVRPSFMNSDRMTTAGTVSAKTLSQNWKACTKVIERIPPPSTVASTITPAAATPAQAGSPVTVFSTRPAPCSWGSR
jgi:hypothetical protein